MRSLENGGFTLIELIMALTITGVILITIVFLSTNAVRYQTEGVFRGRATSSAIYSLARMRSELEDATYVYNLTCGGGSISTTGCNAVLACTNWSPNAAGPNAGAAYVGSAPVNTIYYCVSGTQMYRYVQAGGCNTGFAPACGSGATETVVPDPPGIYHTDYPGAGTPVFLRTGDRSLDVHYIVGYPGMKPNQRVPVDYLFNFRINTNQMYNDSTR